MIRIRNVLFLALGLLVACTTAPSADPDPDMEACEQIRQRMPDMAEVSELRYVGSEIVKGVPRARLLEWDFYLIEADEPYAFALPNGVIAVTSGLYKLALNDAQLAGIIGHEVAHVLLASSERPHLCTELVARLGWAGSDAAAKEPKADHFVDTVIALERRDPYSPEEEEVVDRYGLRYVAEGHFAPIDSLRSWERLADIEKTHPPQFFRVHPPAENRVAALKRFLAEAMAHYHSVRAGYFDFYSYFPD